MSKVMSESLNELRALTLDLPPASIVLAESETGTAYQRFFSDGLYHSASGRIVSLDHLRGFHFVRIIYLAPTTTDEVR